MLKIENKEKIDPNESVYDFFLNFFQTLPATLEEDGTPQCVGGKLRTYKDLIRIFNYYYPDYPAYCLNDELIRLVKRHIINCVYCGNVHDITYFPYNYGEREYYSYKCLFVVISNRLYFNKVGIFCRYSGYSQRDFERCSIAETMKIMKVSEPNWN